MVILDTNVISELTRQKPEPRVIAWVDQQEDDQVFITAISKGEIIFGLEIMAAGRKKFELEETYRQLFSTRFPGRVLPYDDQCAHYLARFAAMSRKLGRNYEISDLQIAAIAASNYAALATRNVDHFDHVGLEVVNPWTA